MFSERKRIGVVAVLGLMLSAIVPLRAYGQRPNPNYLLTPGLSVRQVKVLSKTVAFCLS